MTGFSERLETPARLQRFLGFLDQDPDNLALLADAAAAALDDGDLEAAGDLLGRYQALAPLTPSLLNLEGVVAMQAGRFDEAATRFAALRQAHGEDPALRFNSAWSLAMLNRYEDALALLDDAVLAVAPRAAALKIQMLHHLGRLDEGLEAGAVLAAGGTADPALLGALATLALDAEDMDLAAVYAARAGDHPEGLATLGMLSLGEHGVEESVALFDNALRVHPENARALLGKGLALMVKGDSHEAARFIDRGAEVFGDHIGSWVASGWAHFVNGEQAKARAAFDRALALDDTFAESHGALAVLDILDGQIESARRRTETALRLDRSCFAGALAKTLLLTADGNPEAAERVRTLALNTPIGPNGETIAQAMVGFGLTSGWTSPK